MKKHAAAVHEKKNPFKCKVCDYSCAQKGSMEIQVASVYEKTNHFNVFYVITNALKKHI